MATLPESMAPPWESIPILRCEKCIALFTCMQLLRTHFCVRRYSCIVCNITFNSRALLQIHIQCENHQARTFSSVKLAPDTFWKLKNRGLIDKKYPMNVIPSSYRPIPGNDFKASSGSQDAFMVLTSPPMQDSHVSSQTHEEAAYEEETPQVSCSHEKASLPHDSGESTLNTETTVCQLSVNNKGPINQKCSAFCNVNENVETTDQSTANGTSSIILKSVNTIPESSVSNKDTAIYQDDAKIKSVPNRQEHQNIKDASNNQVDHIGTSTDNYEDKTEFRKKIDQTEGIPQPQSRLGVPGISDKSPLSQGCTNNDAITNTNASASLPGSSPFVSKCDFFPPEAGLSKQLIDAVGTHERQVEEVKTSDPTETEAHLTDSVAERGSTNCLTNKLITDSMKRNTVLSTKTKTLVAAWLRQSVLDRGTETKSDISKTPSSMNRTTSVKSIFSDDEVQENNSYPVNHSRSKKLEKLRSEIEKEKAFTNIRRGLISECDAYTENRIISFKVKTLPPRRANSVDNESGAESSSPSSVEDIFDYMSTRDLKGQQKTASKNPTRAKTSKSSKATKEKENAKKLRIADNTELSMNAIDHVKINCKTHFPTVGETCTTHQREASKTPMLTKTSSSSKAADEKENDKELRVADSSEISMRLEESVQKNDKTSSAPFGEKYQHNTGERNKLRLSDNRHSKENDAPADDDSDVFVLYSSSGKKERNCKPKKIKTPSYGTDRVSLTSPKQERKIGREITKASSSDEETRSGKVDNTRTQTDERIKRSISLMDRIQANESLKKAYETPSPVIERKQQLQNKCVSDSSPDTESESNDADSSSPQSLSSRNKKCGSHYQSFNCSNSPGNSSEDQHKSSPKRKRDRSRSRENSKHDQPKNYSENRHSRMKIRNSCSSTEEKRRLSRSTSSESEDSQSSTKRRRLDNDKLHNRRPSPRKISDSDLERSWSQNCSRTLEGTPEKKSLDGKGKITIINRDIISQTNKNLIRKILSSNIKHKNHRERTQQCISDSSELLQKKEDSSINKSRRNNQDVLSEEDEEDQEKDQEENTDSLEAQIKNHDKNVNDVTKGPVISSGLIRVDMNDSNQEQRKRNLKQPGTVDNDMHCDKENGSENKPSSQDSSVCKKQESNPKIQEENGDRNVIIQSDVIITKPCEEQNNNDQRHIQSEIETACISSVATDAVPRLKSVNTENERKSVATDDVRKLLATDDVEPVSLDGYYPKCFVESKEFREDSETNILGEAVNHCEENEKKTRHCEPNTENVKIQTIICETSKAERDVNFNKVSNYEKSMNDVVTDSIESNVQALDGDNGYDIQEKMDEHVDSTHSYANDHHLFEIEEGKEFEFHLQEFRTVDPNTEVVKPKVPLCPSDRPEVPVTRGHLGECMETELTTLQQSDNFLTISCKDSGGQLTTLPGTDHQHSTSSYNDSQLTLLQKTDYPRDSTGSSGNASEFQLSTENFPYCQSECSDPMFEEDNLSDVSTVMILFDTDDEQVNGVTNENKLSINCVKTTSPSIFFTPNDVFSVNQESEIRSTTGFQMDTLTLPKRPSVQDKATSHILGREECQSNLPTSDNKVSKGPQRRKNQLHRSTKDKMHSEKSKRWSKTRSPERKLKETKREPERDPRLQKKKPMKRVETNYVKYMTTHCPECNTAFVLDEFMSVNLSTGDVSMKCPNCLMYTCMVGVVLNELKKVCGRHKHSPKDPKCIVNLSEKAKGEDNENLKSKHKSRSKKSQEGRRHKEESKPRKTEDKRDKRRKERNRTKDKAVPPDSIAIEDANTERKILSAAVKRKTDHKEDDGRKKVRTKDKEKVVYSQKKKCG